MAVVAVILGGLFGFVNFVVALLVYEAGLLKALAIYSASGLSFAIGIILITCATRAMISLAPVRTQHRERSAEQF